MSFVFGRRSLENLNGVHPDLMSCAQYAIRHSTHDFTVIEGLRDIERQRELVAKGMSRTMNSRHLTGHAIDVWPFPAPKREVTKKDFILIIDAFRKASDELNIPLEFGIDWGWDAPHIQLPRKQYPA